MADDENPDDAHWLGSVRQSSPYAGLGWQIAGALVTFVGIGLGLDLWLGTTPWLTLAGALGGVVSIFALLYRVNAEMNAASRQRKMDVKRRGNAGPDAA